MNQESGKKVGLVIKGFFKNLIIYSFITLIISVMTFWLWTFTPWGYIEWYMGKDGKEATEKLQSYEKNDESESINSKYPPEFIDMDTTSFEDGHYIVNPLERQTLVVSQIIRNNSDSIYKKLALWVASLFERNKENWSFVATFCFLFIMPIIFALISMGILWFTSYLIHPKEKPFHLKKIGTYVFITIWVLFLATLVFALIMRFFTSEDILNRILLYPFSWVFASLFVSIIALYHIEGLSYHLHNPQIPAFKLGRPERILLLFTFILILFSLSVIGPYFDTATITNQKHLKISEANWNTTVLVVKFMLLTSYLGILSSLVAWRAITSISWWTFLRKAFSFIIPVTIWLAELKFFQRVYGFSHFINNTGSHSLFQLVALFNIHISAWILFLSALIPTITQFSSNLEESLFGRMKRIITKISGHALLIGDYEDVKRLCAYIIADKLNKEARNIVSGKDKLLERPQDYKSGVRFWIFLDWLARISGKSYKNAKSYELIPRVSTEPQNAESGKKLADKVRFEYIVRDIIAVIEEEAPRHWIDESIGWGKISYIRAFVFKPKYDIVPFISDELASKLKNMDIPKTFLIPAVVGKIDNLYIWRKARYDNAKYAIFSVADGQKAFHIFQSLTKGEPGERKNN